MDGASLGEFGAGNEPFPQPWDHLGGVKGGASGNQELLGISFYARAEMLASEMRRRKLPRSQHLAGEWYDPQPPEPQGRDAGAASGHLESPVRSSLYVRAEGLFQAMARRRFSPQKPPERSRHVPRSFEPGGRDDGAFGGASGRPLPAQG
eukprot:CAMPEP_0114111052 /NCGR_PEP_ID=MMETSP0043_2-20121206/1640_1 /TAXON_ID=464988 /ORGANISM="Hemiselmis andersenii, Strain CCMP644" /LENGTH=149 /DNA_ID=CAMNT_0001203043 /DNA_START=364 /DNA_END=813 /DNA_ORIENTATION=-